MSVGAMDGASLSGDPEPPASTDATGRTARPTLIVLSDGPHAPAEGAALAVRDVPRVLGADPHDFAGLYIRHRTTFAAHASRFLADREEVDDVVQEAFLRLFLAMPELTDELQALAYCRRTVTNLCIDRFRADQRRPRLVDLDSLPGEALVEDECDDPVVRAEDAAVVREALSLLSPLHRAALVKREIEEKPIPVIADELAIPEDSVKHLLFRARRALRRHLAQTHLAPGVDLDDTSTAVLVARAAARTGGRAGVVVLVLAGLALGVGTTTDVESSPLRQAWPLSEILSTKPGASAVSAAPPRELSTPEPISPVFRKERPAGRGLLLPGAGGAAVVPPLVAPSPSTAPAALPQPTVATPAATPAPAGSSPTAAPSPVPSSAPSAEPSPTGSPGPTASPEPGPEPPPSSTPTPTPTRSKPGPSPEPSPKPLLERAGGARG